MNALGKKPMLAWIDKTLLSVEPSYQRLLSAKASRALITKLAVGFSWAHCAPLIVAPKGKAWVIIDGQHRQQAALRRDDIKDLPCYVVDAKDLKDHARAFVAHNRDRVNLSALSLFHAGVAAGEAVETGVVAACSAAGVEIPRTGGTVQLMMPNQTIATGVLTRILEADGPERLTDVLSVIREAHPNAQGQLRGRTIGAIAAIMRHSWVKRAELIKVVRAFDGQRLENTARALATDRGLTLNEAFVGVLVSEAGVEAQFAIDALRAGDKAVASERVRSWNAARKAARPEGAPAKPGTAKARKPFQFDRSKPAPPPSQACRDPRQRPGAPLRDGRVRPRQRRLPEALRLRGQQKAEWLRREEGRRTRQAEAHDPRAGDRAAQSGAQEARPAAGHQG